MARKKIKTESPVETQRHKLYVGVDYGTTYSGFAYVYSRQSDAPMVEVVHEWPGNSSGYLQKVPSQIAYKAENPQLDKDVWGYEIPPHVNRQYWTKLLLDKRAPVSKFDDSDLKDTLHLSALPLPQGKSPEIVVSDFLSHLYKHCMGLLEKRMTTGVLSATPIEFWFTMPAIWSDEAQYATKRAAERAGFGKSPLRELDSINMITEPEAASIAALRSSAGTWDNLLETNTGIMICDCGGGTIDITCYTIVATNPTLQLEQSCVLNGGKCGAIFVDKNFQRLMTARYGSHFTDLPQKTRGPGSPFMRNFEAIKNDFNGRNHRSSSLQLIMKNLTDGDARCINYDPDECQVELTIDDIKQCFDPVAAKLLELTEEQAKAVTKMNAPRVATLVLVGGLSESPYIWNKIKEWCEAKNIRPICPERSWSAIVRGAALRGLHGPIVTRRMCSRHYGLMMAHPFQPDLEVRDQRVYYNHFHDKEYRAGWMTWPIEKGVKLGVGEKRAIDYMREHRFGDLPICTLDLFSCSLDHPPERDDNPVAPVEKVGTVQIRYPDIALAKFQHREVEGKDHSPSKDIWYHIRLTCEIGLAEEVGVLQISVKCDKKQVGTAKLIFPCD